MKSVFIEKNFIKKGIFENVNSFLKRIEKGADTLLPENFEDNEIVEGEEEKNEEIGGVRDISSRLEAEINQIYFW